MKLIPYLALLALVLAHGEVVAQGKKFSEEYGKKWVEERSPSGKFTVAKSTYTARDKAGKTVRHDVVQIFTNGPRGDNTDASNWWAYWYNPTKDVIWGRCPTPKHPKYREWQKNAKGNDLWQIIPPADRKPGVINVTQLKWPKASGEDKVISTEASGTPTITGSPAGPNEQVITCIDFGGTISRYTR